MAAVAKGQGEQGPVGRGSGEDAARTERTWGRSVGVTPQVVGRAARRRLLR